MTAVTQYAPRTAPRGTTKSLWKTGAGVGVVASAATIVVAAAARAADVPLEVDGEAIPLFAFAQLTFVCTMIGTLIGAVMSRRASRPASTFVATTVVLTLLSIVPDVLADATNATRAVLALTHVVAAAIVIPVLASRLSD